jgi:hypothetical protein
LISAQGVEKPVLKNKYNENKQEGEMALKREQKRKNWSPKQNT